MDDKKAYILLADGLLLEGTAIGKIGTTGGEICFNTAMTGYQEVYTDPSYYGQILVNTATHIGNYGAKTHEQESQKAMIAGLVVDQFSPVHSRSDADKTLQEFLEEFGVVGIANVDTRKLVKHIRSKGAMNAVISSELSTSEDLQKALGDVPSMDNLELSSEVSTTEKYEAGDPNGKHHVAVLDLGIKTNILRSFEQRGIKATVFPAKTSFEEMEQESPDGYFLSNGPGDPKSMGYAVETAKKITDSGKPVFGICLGHQILARAAGVETFKMHHGHRGVNHPVKNLLTGKGEITSQNHGFCVDMESLTQNPALELTHQHLNDQSVAGLKFKDKPVYSVQFHPEASPGPHDSRYLFDDFVKLLEEA